MRVWLRRLALAVALAVLLPVLAILALVGPYLLDDYRLDAIVRAVALDWRDFGREQAMSRLQYELDHQGIGLQVADSDCSFDDAVERTVRCAWTVDVVVPGAGLGFPLAFESVASILPDGDLR